MRDLAIYIYLLMILPVHGQELFSSYENCTKDTYGFVSVKQGVESIPPTYCAAAAFSEGLAAVKQGDKWGFIDAENKTVIPFRFDAARSFKHGLAIVRKGEFYGMIDKTGDDVVPPIYYDLIPIEVDGRPYYVSRDSTFFAGVIDHKGNQILPHQFTYIISLEAYDHLPFYSSFQAIDTTKGSFYDQFKENPYAFAPEIGRHDIYDTQFNKLASRQSTTFTDGFQAYELIRMDRFLGTENEIDSEKRIEEISRLLALPEPDPDTLMHSHPRNEYLTMTDEEAIERLNRMGYVLFTDSEGRNGIRKGDDPILSAQYEYVRVANSVMQLAQTADLSHLQKHYGGSYRNPEKSIFDIFFLVAGGQPSSESALYDLRGNRILSFKGQKDTIRKALTGTTPIGLTYVSLIEDETGPVSERHGLINWTGASLLPPVFNRIDVLASGLVLASTETEVNGSTRQQVGLFSKTGNPILPMGMYSTIHPFHQTDDLFLVTWNPDTAVAECRASDNKRHAILEIVGDSYNVITDFVASHLSTWALDTATGMLPYRRDKEE